MGLESAVAESEVAEAGVVRPPSTVPIRNGPVSLGQCLVSVNSFKKNHFGNQEDINYSGGQIFKKIITVLFLKKNIPKCENFRLLFSSHCKT